MDTRKQRTKNKIKAAYVDLLMEFDPLAITVSDVSKKACVNRSTFYEHFSYIEELVEDIIEEQLFEITKANDPLLDEYYFQSYTSPSSVERYLQNFSKNEVIMKLIKSSDANHFKILITNLQIRHEFTKFNVVDSKRKNEIIYRNYGAYALIFGWLTGDIVVRIEEISKTLYEAIKI